jgi:uncharacterized protein (DUF1697 family)
MTLQTWIALLRGVNVGGHHTLAMQTWAKDLEQLGMTHVKTYIQSGNAVFRGPKTRPAALAQRIAAAIADRHGFRPDVLLLRPEDLARAIDSNPFPEAATIGKSLSLFFLSEAPAHPDRKGLDAAQSETERWSLLDDRFYLHAPDGFGRSQLAAKAVQLLGVQATARNWNTVLKLHRMAKELE